MCSTGNMGKRSKSSEVLLKKKRGRDDIIELKLIRADGTADDDDDVMECLAELDKKQGVVTVTGGVDALPDPLTCKINNDDEDDGVNKRSEEASASTSIFQRQRQRYSNDFFLSNDKNGLNAQIEVSRHNFASKLSRWLLESCSPNLRIASFERWIIDSKMEEYQKRTAKSFHVEELGRRRRREKYKRDKPRGVDVIFPSMPHIQDKATQNLLQEIIVALSSSSSSRTHTSSSDVTTKGNIKAAAKSICSELCAKTMKYAKALENLAERQRGTFNAANNNILLERTNSNQYSLILQRTNKTSFCVRINTNHYTKLYQTFLKACHPNHNHNELSFFHLLLFVMIVRYSTLAGGQQCCLKDSRGGGMQGAIHGEVFDFLREFFSSSSQDTFLFLECFASPLNTYCIHSNSFTQEQQHYYCSAFPDIGEVSAFGSIGSFFSLPVGSLPDGCCCEANPPFAPILMTTMARKIEEHLKSSSEQNKTLIFVVIVPTAKSAINLTTAVESAARESFLLLQSSKFLQKHIILKSKEHGYIEASQHIRHTHYKESQYDTSVFLLATYNPSMHRDWVTKSRLIIFEDGIRKAFASKHKEELMERRKKSKISGDVTSGEKQGK